MFEKILVALDGSDHDRATIDATVSFAALAASDVTVLHVRDVHFIGRAGDISSEEFAEARGIVDDAVARLTSEGIKAVGEYRETHTGSIAQEILAVAKSSAASVIVMGSHGRGDIERLLLGSTTDKVLHLGMLPVFVVR